MSVVLNAGEIARALRRISHEILEHNKGSQSILLLGIPTRGAFLSKRIASMIEEIEGHEMPHGTLDVTMYRDDLRLRPPRALMSTEIPISGINEMHVVLVDDVLYSGRTIRAALDALSELGRPASVQLAVLVDRGHRELPIRADFVGKNLPTSSSERVHVLLQECDESDEVVIEAQS
ncbi:MAG: bifunctional pyr operon transcriptional regulator/uracil phosphoribosyltransferase PyrR [Actinobacteria bacterium]|nr:bifunctional pyr operon transcriptional regulator/uracil phosphoribosyltransferase PyrR [Actinomycetota bacterium]